MASLIIIHDDDTSGEGNKLHQYYSVLASKYQAMVEQSEDSKEESGKNYPPESIVISPRFCRALPATHSYPIVSLSKCINELGRDVPSSNNNIQRMSGLGCFRRVALGGTFDRLHPGHKLLLSTALLCSSHSLVVGVTDESMLDKKTHADLIQPYSTRVANVRAFLANLTPPEEPCSNSGVSGRGVIWGRPEISVVPLHDPCGPTVTDWSIEALVITQENILGAQKINDERRGKGMRPLTVVMVDEIVMKGGSKISSTHLRSLLQM